MADLPKISRMKFGIIDEMYMNTLRDGVENFNALKPAIHATIAKSSKHSSPPFLAQIIGVPDALETIDMERDSATENDVPVVWKYRWKAYQVSSVDSETSYLTLTYTIPILVNENISTSVDTEDGEHEGIISGYAYNLAELGNVGTYNSDGIVFGVDVTSASYPVGFYPKEVATGCFVMLQKMFTRDARVIYLFDRQGTHDGNCT